MIEPLMHNCAFNLHQNLRKLLTGWRKFLIQRKWYSSLPLKFFFSVLGISTGELKELMKNYLATATFVSEFKNPY